MYRYKAIVKDEIWTIGHWTGVESMFGVVGGCLLSAEKKNAIGIKEKTSVY